MNELYCSVPTRTLCSTKRIFMFRVCNQPDDTHKEHTNEQFQMIASIINTMHGCLLSYIYTYSSNQILCIRIQFRRRLNIFMLLWRNSAWRGVKSVFIVRMYGNFSDFWTDSWNCLNIFFKDIEIEPIFFDPLLSSSEVWCELNGPCVQSSNIHLCGISTLPCKKN